MYPQLYFHREQLQELFIDTADQPLAALHFHAPIELEMVLSGTLEAWVGNEHRILHFSITMQLNERVCSIKINYRGGTSRNGNF